MNRNDMRTATYKKVWETRYEYRNVSYNAFVVKRTFSYLRVESSLLLD